MANEAEAIGFLRRAAAPGESTAIWMIHVSPYFPDESSYKFESGSEMWVIKIHASSFQSAAYAMNECRRALGWGQMEEVLL